MAAFAYNAIDASGRRTRGVFDAPQINAARHALEQTGLIVLRVEPARHPARGWRHRRATLAATRSVAALLQAGVPLARALARTETIVPQDFAAIVRDVRSRVERGEALASALEQHSTVFPALYRGLVRAGERSGDLTGTFGRLAAHLEQEEQLRGRLISAAMYPLLLAGVGAIALLALLIFVLPKFVDLLEGAGAALPASTALLLAASGFTRQAWPFVMLAAPPCMIVMAYLKRTEPGQRCIARVMLGVPLVSGIRRKSLAARFARMTAVLLHGGTPLLQAVDAAAESMPDPIARAEVLRVRGLVRNGEALHRALADVAIFPPLLRDLAAIGEETGRLGDFLAKAADVLEDETQRALQRLVTFAEPAMIIILGGVIALVALSLLQAIYGLNAGTLG